MNQLNRKQLFADKMYFNKESLIPVNALQLIDELVEQERLERDNKWLTERVGLLEFQLENARSALSDLDIKNHRYYDISGRTY